MGTEDEKIQDELFRRMDETQKANPTAVACSRWGNAAMGIPAVACSRTLGHLPSRRPQGRPPTREATKAEKSAAKRAIKHQAEKTKHLAALREKTKHLAKKTEKAEKSAAPEATTKFQDQDELFKRMDAAQRSNPTVPWVPKPLGQASNKQARWRRNKQARIRRRDAAARNTASVGSSAEAAAAAAAASNARRLGLAPEEPKAKKPKSNKPKNAIVKPKKPNKPRHFAKEAKTAAELNDRELSIWLASQLPLGLNRAAFDKNMRGFGEGVQAARWAEYLYHRHSGPVPPEEDQSDPVPPDEDEAAPATAKVIPLPNCRFTPELQWQPRGI